MPFKTPRRRGGNFKPDILHFRAIVTKTGLAYCYNTTDWSALMFTIHLKHDIDMAFMEIVGDSREARDLAETWSNYTAFELVVLEDGQPSPRCIFRNGKPIVCRCPDTQPDQPLAAAL
jgi:hypothetical protein